MLTKAPPPALTPRKRPRQARSAFTVDAVVEAAVRVLLAEGYARLTTRRVAEVAGVSVGSLYQYFPNRAALVAEVIRRKVEAGVSAMERAAAEAEAAPRPGPATAGAPIAAALRALAEEKQRGLALAAALRGPLAELDGRRALAEGARRVEALFAGVLARHLGRPLDPAEGRRLALAVAALEGAVAALAERDPAGLGEPGLGDALARMALAALDLGGVPHTEA